MTRVLTNEETKELVTITTNDRAKEMVKRFWAGDTLAAIGNDYGISKERVRQILVKETGIKYPFQARQAIKNVFSAVAKVAKYIEQLPKHGTRYMYVYYQCKCDECQAANTAYTIKKYHEEKESYHKQNPDW